MSIRAIAVGTLLVVGCVSLVMLLLMRRGLSILVPPLVLTRWTISLFFSFLTHLLLPLLCLLQDLLPLMSLLRHRPPLLRLVLLVLLILRSLPLLFPLLHRRLLRRLPLMIFPLLVLFVSVVPPTVTLLVSMVFLLPPSRLLIGMLSIILNGSWPWLRRLLRLSAPAPGILFLLLPVFVLSRVSGSIRLRPALMDLLSAIKRVLWLVVFSRSMVVTMMRPLLLSLI